MPSESPPELELILGYVRNVDYRDPEARANDLEERCAVLWPEPAGEAPVFPAELAVAVSRALADAVGADAARVELDESSQGVLPSLDALAAHYRGLPPSMRAPFHRIELTADDALAGLARVERDTNERHRGPYAGRSGLVCFAKRLDARTLERGLARAASVAGFARGETRHARRRPRISLLRRTIDFIVNEPEDDPAH